MPFPNWEIYVSVAFYFGAKIIGYTFKSVCYTSYTSYTSRMSRTDPLTSIPERSEIEEPLKWVPKKKHEVLKAKYKCLKKLFQIYDASVIGAVPAPSIDIDNTDYTMTKRQRRKRSHRTKTDACEDTTEMNGVIMQEAEYDSASIATENRSLKNKQSCSTQMDSKFEDVSTSQVESQKSKYEIINSESNSNSDFTEMKCSQESVREKCTHFPQNNVPQHILPQPQPQPQHVVPYLAMNGRRKLTRFQCFVQRIFGIRQDYILPSEAYAASECFNVGVKRRGLRVRRLRKVKKIRSESDVDDIKSSAILTYVQSVQRSCLMDTTPRQCPIVGCNMMSYGIINYNDHLNLCHFMDRKYFCHYCHEGFEKEYDKFVHESEHIGLNRLGNNISNLSSARSKLANNSNTQTDDVIPDDKLKKIVSFFDKITNPDQIISAIAKKRSSELNLFNNDTESQNSCEKRTVSCINVERELKCKCMSNSHTSVTSHQCGLPCHHNDQFKGQLSLHGDLERRYRDRLPKYPFSEGNLCPRVPAAPCKQSVDKPRDNRRRRELVYEDGRLNVRSIDSSSKTETALSTMTPSISNVKLTQGKSGQSIGYGSSTDIVYCTSQETVNIPSEESLARKVRHYKWEPGTKIINV